jgi:nuclear protein localization family protein 4
MDQLALLRKEQAKRYAEHGPVSMEGSSSCCSVTDNVVHKKRGKVVCGKYFENPPMKLTMPEMEHLLNMYVRIAPQKEPTISQVRMDSDSAEFFQAFLQRSQFCIQRYGLMFGTYEQQDHSVTVDCIYEPKQSAVGISSYQEINDSIMIDQLLSLTKAFGLQLVGWIFSHPLDRDYVLSGAEVLKTADLMSKYGNHCVVISVSPREDATTTDFHPYQVSTQCATIYKEGTLSAKPTAPNMIHSERELEAVNEAKSNATHVLRHPTHDVDAVLFILPLPIVGYRSQVTRNRFSRINRPDHRPTLTDDVHKLLQNRSTEPFYQVLNDFHLLVFLLDIRVITLEVEVPLNCESVRTKSDVLLEGIRCTIDRALRPLPGGRTTTQSPSPPRQTKPSRITEDDVRRVANVCSCNDSQARQALETANGNVQLAINYLV